MSIGIQHLDKAVILFVKSPKRTNTKKRLCPPLTPEQASTLAEAIMLDGVEIFCSLKDLHVHLFFEAQEDKDYYADHFPDVPQFAQQGETTGDRITAAFDELFVRGYRRIMMFEVGIPTLPMRNILSSFQLLDAFDDSFVIGPDEHGGIYALGMRLHIPDVFRGLTLDKSDSYNQMMKRICALESAVYVLPPWYSIETVADVRRLSTDIMNPEFGDTILRRTKNYMHQLRDLGIVTPLHTRKKS